MRREVLKAVVGLPFALAFTLALAASVAVAATDHGEGDGHGSTKAHSASHGHKKDEKHEMHGSGHKHTMVEVSGSHPPTLKIAVTRDAVGGWNLHIMTKNFSFSPTEVNKAHVPGQGHAHLYVDGKKLSRIYSEWFHFDGLSPGEHQVMVTLNANNHGHISVKGEPLAATVRIIQ